MKISIDTKEDSHEDIRRVIKMLQHLVGEESYSNNRNIFEDNSPSLPAPAESSAPTNAFSAMFGDNSSPANVAETAKESASSSEDIRKKIKFDMDNEIVPY